MAESGRWQRVVHPFFFIRAVFIRAEMMSTENFGKIRAGEYSNLLRYKG